jgi:hypothetical protein
LEAEIGENTVLVSVKQAGFGAGLVKGFLSLLAVRSVWEGTVRLLVSEIGETTVD